MRKRLGKLLAGIPPTDRWLLLILAILLGQSAYSLFAGPGSHPESGDIDVIVRTASAAIFGYFLSARGRQGEGIAGAGGHMTAAAAAVGLFCLLVLLALRDMAPEDPAAAGSDSATATVAQFRDFISGCVGLLIGAPSGGARPPSQES